jgi:hypothetical protein
MIGCSRSAHGCLQRYTLELMLPKTNVVPAKAGIHNPVVAWIPAFAGMTDWEGRLTSTAFRCKPVSIYSPREVATTPDDPSDEDS